MASRFIILITITSVLLVGVLLFTLPSSQQALSIPAYGLPARAEPGQAELQLTEAALDWEVAAAHQQTDEQLSALTETLGSGVCAFDANKDGWMDLFLVGGSGHTRHYGRRAWWHLETGNRLLLNQKGTHFRDVTEQAGLENSQWGMGCAVADFDNNGWPDLVVTGVSSNKLYSNGGDAHFTDVTNGSGILPEQWSTGASLADYNNDSLVDIYISNYVAFEKGARTFERNKGFAMSTVPFDATLYDPLPNKLYLNQGNFRFLDTTEAAGVMDSLGRSLGAHWTDLNGDGWQDLIVINDADSPNQVYINDTGKRFTLSQSSFSLLETPDSRDLLEEDFDNDGQSELLITQNSSAAPIFAVRASTGDEKYTDRAWTSGIADKEHVNAVNWGAAGGDFNNDGHMDVFIANGGTLPDIDSPFAALGQHNELLLGAGNGRFVRQEKWLDAFQPLSSRAAITADLDNDGVLEIIVTNNNDPVQLFAVSGARKTPWIGIDLYQDNGFTDAAGARVKITAGEHVIHRTVRSRQGFLGSGDNRLLVALDDAADRVAVTVSWPDGTESVFSGLDTGHYYTVNKAENSILPSPAVAESDRPVAAAIAAADDSAKVRFGLLLRDIATDDSEMQFSRLWEASNDAVKAQLLLSFADNWQRRDLRYLKRSMDSMAEPLNLLAIEQVKSLEMEQSIAWLIPMLGRKSDRVSCAAANTLQFFFEEEEAVTHRKYLAVPPLVQLLQEGSEVSAICAANALAAAESKRAVLPLMELARTASSEGVASASVRALGLIRDSGAIPLLSGIVGDPQQYPAPVVAEALIALQRLNDPHIELYVDNLFDAANYLSPAGKLLPFQVANSLIASDETIVFPKKNMLAKLEALLSTLRRDEIDAAGNTALATAVLSSIRLAKLGAFQSIAEHLRDSQNPDIRKSAYDALIALDSDWPATVLPGLLQKESTELVLAVLAGAGKGGAALNADALDMLAMRLHAYGPMAAELGPVLDSINLGSARALLATLYARGLPEERLSTMLPLCDKHSGAISGALSSLDLQQRAALQYLYLYCQFTPGRKAAGATGDTLADRLQLKNVLESNQYREAEKRRLLLRAAADDRVIAQTMLLYSVESYSGDDLLGAIDVLSQHHLADKVTAFLWSLLTDDNTPLAIRFAAASQLLPIRGDDVIEYIDTHFLVPHATG
ncbi:MAG: VCBS repeat-containing protein [Halioglobus sp.]|nr:VCBS repeat-containing protein [Halioglobus sp.]